MSGVHRHAAAAQRGQDVPRQCQTWALLQGWHGDSAKRKIYCIRPAANNKRCPRSKKSRAGAYDIYCIPEAQGQTLIPQLKAHAATATDLTTATRSQHRCCRWPHAVAASTAPPHSCVVLRARSPSGEWEIHVLEFRACMSVGMGA